jgi:hypothetical protein
VTMRTSSRNSSRRSPNMLWTFEITSNWAEHVISRWPENHSESSFAASFHDKKWTFLKIQRLFSKNFSNETDEWGDRVVRKSEISVWVFGLCWIIGQQNSRDWETAARCHQPIYPIINVLSLVECQLDADDLTPVLRRQHWKWMRFWTTVRKSSSVPPYYDCTGVKSRMLSRECHRHWSC